jgi:acyl-ACP thioesterase
MPGMESAPPVRVPAAAAAPAASPGLGGPDGAVGPDFQPDPAAGRVFRVSRMVRSTDVTPGGRLRFDALARYLQEAAEDDLADTGQDGGPVWLVRRAAVAVHGYPGHGDQVTLRTFCSGTGPRWAERTTTVAGPAGDLIQARVVWAAVSRADGRPVALGEDFHRWYGPSAGGRRVSARLSLAPPPQQASAAARPWPVRQADFDTAGHVNNSVHWAAVEDELAALAWRPARAELEYHRPIRPGDEPALVAETGPGRLAVWLQLGSRRLASAMLRTEVTDW